MIFQITSLLALIALCFTVVSSAPIHVHNSRLNALQNRALHSGLEARSMFWGHSHHQDRSRLVYRDGLEYSGFVARDAASRLAIRSLNEVGLEARSFDDIAEYPLVKRSKDIATGDVHRRSLWGSIKKAAGSVGRAASKAVSTVRKGVQNVASKAVNTVKKGVQKVAQTAKKAVNAVANKVKQGVRKVTNTVKKGVQAVKNAAHKVVKFVKQNGAKYAKIGFKAVAMATKVASHVVAVIPGVGKAAGRVLSTASKVADFVSDKIPAKLSSGMQKTMGVFEKIEHPLGTGAAGEILDAVLKRDMEEEGLFKRDLFEGEELLERDLPMLEPRYFNSDFEREARWFDDASELDARTWGIEDDA